jgi:hypothetical protein
MEGKARIRKWRSRPVMLDATTHKTSGTALKTPSNVQGIPDGHGALLFLWPTLLSERLECSPSWVTRGRGVRRSLLEGLLTAFCLIALENGSMVEGAGAPFRVCSLV